MEHQIEIFKTKDNQTEVQVRFEQETVWLDAHMIASLFAINRPAIEKHIQNIYQKFGATDRSSYKEIYIKEASAVVHTIS